MVVWAADEPTLDLVGKSLLQNRRVSHCYVRPLFKDFPYNLYTMLHAQSCEELLEIIGKISSETGLKKYEVLESVREFKKSSPVYF